MAKNKITIDIEVNGKMQKATVSAKKLRDALGSVDKAQKDVGESAQTTDRRLKGASQQSANGTKNFSKMAQGITNGLVPAYATLAANLFAVSAAFEFLKRAAQLEQLEKAQVSFAQNTGIALQSITSSLREASSGLLGFREAAEAAAIGTAKGFSSKQLNDLAEGAKRASAALGRDFGDSFDRLVRGISKAEPELLDELGITLRLEKATKDYANALGIQADQLTDVQRSQAVLVATQRQLDDFYGNVDAGTNAFIELGKTFEDLVKTVTSSLMPVFNFLADVINRNATLAVAAFAGFGISIIKAFAPLDEISAKFKKFQTDQEASVQAAKNELKSYRAEIERVVTASENLAAKGRGRIQAGATAAVMGGSKSKILEKVTTGGFESLARVEQANLKRMLDAAAGHVNEFGIITKGAFKGMALSMVNDMQRGLFEIEQKTKVTETKLKVSFKNIALGGKIAAAEIRLAFANTFQFMQRGAMAVGGAFTKLFKIIQSLLTLQFVLEIIDQLPLAADSFIRNVSKLLAKIPIIGKVFDDMLPRYEKSGLAEWFRDYRADLQKTKEETAKLKQIQRDIVTVSSEAASMAQAAMTRDMTPKQVLSAYSTLDFAGILDRATNLEASGATKDTIVQDIIKAADPLLKTGQFEKFREVIISSRGNIDALAAGFTYLQETAGLAVAEQESFMDQLNRATEISNSGDFDQIINYVRQLGLTAENATTQSRILGETFQGFDELIETAFGEDINTTALLTSINRVLEGEEAVKERALEASKRQSAILEENNQFDRERLTIADDLLTAGDRYQAALVAQQRAAVDLALATTENEAAVTRAATEADREAEAARRNLEAVAKTVSLRTELNNIAEREYQLRADQDFLKLQQSITKEMQKQFDLENRRQDIVNRQARMTMEDDLAEEARKPFGFIDQEQRELQARIDLETDLIQQKEAQIEDEIQRKKDAINLEYDLLKVQFELEKLRMDRLALESPDEKIREKAKEMSETIESKVIGPEGVIEQNRKSALAETEESVRAGLAEMIRNRDNLILMKEDLMDINVLVDGVSERFANGMTDAFASVIDGTAKAKDAFGQMARSILSYIIQMTVKMLVFRAISGFMNFGGGSAGAPLEGSGMNTYDFASNPSGMMVARYGGVFSNGKKMPGYSAGGIAKGPDRGYLATLHGTEAVVPLPNGREIPVQMTGSGQQNNNVTVNVAVDNQGNATTNTFTDDADAGKLGVAISEAVKKELLNQKRAGGMLSPYGVA